MEHALNEFLKDINSIFYGDGSGNGNGYGEGYGEGDGSGNGEGYGEGNGNGYGDGYGGVDGGGGGNGNGKGLLQFNHEKVYYIDNIPTIINQVKSNVAKGYIINNDYTTSPTYIIHHNHLYAHGATLKEAKIAIEEKIIFLSNIEEKILRFKGIFKDFNKKYSANKFYIWHNMLTGSCKQGRDRFCDQHNINIDTDKLSVYEFIELTKDNYRGDIIKKLLS